jgi:hypothetical protein
MAPDSHEQRGFPTAIERPTTNAPTVLAGVGRRLPVPGAAVLLAPDILSVKHWSRLLAGELYAASPRIDWPTLLRRSFDVDILACSKCGGRLRLLGQITEPSLVRLVLETFGLPAEAPPIARARDPTELLGENEQA